MSDLVYDMKTKQTHEAFIESLSSLEMMDLYTVTLKFTKDKLHHHPCILKFDQYDYHYDTEPVYSDVYAVCMDVMEQQGSVVHVFRVTNNNLELVEALHK